MAERVDAVAVNFGDRARRAEFEIAGHERHAEWIAGTKRLIPRRGGGDGILAAGARHHRQEALLTERGGKRIDHRRVEAADRQRRRDGPQHRPDAGVEAVAEHLHVVRVLRERAHPRERLAQRIAHVLGRQRHLQRDARRRPTRRGLRGRFDHFVDRGDTRDRFLGELPERVRDGADEAAVDIDGAAAHAGDDAGIGERTAFELGENQVAARPDDVAQHAKDVHLEILQLIALKHGFADANHSRFELIDRKRCGRRGEADAKEEQQAQKSDRGAGFHRFTHR